MRHHNLLALLLCLLCCFAGAGLALAQTDDVPSVAAEVEAAEVTEAPATSQAVDAVVADVEGTTEPPPVNPTTNETESGAASMTGGMVAGEGADDGSDSITVEEFVRSRVDELGVKNKEAMLAGNNAWMLTSAALVLFMTAPGLALFYSGLVRRKNVLGVMMQCLFLMGLMTVIWGLWGYSLAFGGGDSALIGNLDHAFMSGIKMERGVAPSTVLSDLPDLTFMVFQGMFFIITPALICGAFAERMKFSTMVVFSILWGTFIYCPLAHWVWGGGLLAYGEEGALAGGALDFAGGTVVHISSGVSALLCAILIGRRLGFGHDDMRPHNLTYTAMGAAMLWVGWFGFNAGSAGASNGLAANAFVVTHFSAAAGAMAWAGMEWITRGKASILGTASGAVAGLVCITPASGFVQPMPALIIGIAGGVICFFACSTLKAKFGYDDSLDAFGVHGVGGTVGALLTGVFATTHVNPDYADGLFYDLKGGTTLMIGQIVAVLVTVVFSLVGTFVILKVLDVAMGLRVSQEDETQGLDQSQHGEEGYIVS